MNAERVRVLRGDDGPDLDLVEGAGSARAIVWSGVGARMRAMHRLVLGSGARTREQRHPGEAVYAVISGAGEVTDKAGRAHPLREGSMFHVESATAYVIVAGPAGMEAVGGPAPVDPALYEPREA